MRHRRPLVTNRRCLTAQLLPPVGSGVAQGSHAAGQVGELKRVPAEHLLIQQAAVDGQAEIALTEQLMEELRVGDHSKMIVPARVEVAFQLHAACRAALDRGHFQLWITGVPSAASSMIGRFAHLLTARDQQRLASTYTSILWGSET